MDDVGTLARDDAMNSDNESRAATTESRALSSSPVLEALIQRLSTNANTIDQSGTIPREHFDALAAAGLYGAFAPSSLGGLELTLEQMCGVIEELSAACLATTFVWLQHFRLLAALLDPSTPDALQELLPRAINGELKGGVALGGLLPGPPRLRALPSTEGWILDGDAPWVSGWGIVDVLFVTARGPDDTVVSCIIDARAQPGLDVTPHHLTAINATATVRLDFKHFVVEPDRFVNQVPYAPGREGPESLRGNGSLALGVARRSCALIGSTSLGEELNQRRDELDTASGDTIHLARARAAEFAARAAHLLAVTRGSSAALVGDVAERTTREAALLLVFGSRPGIKSALLDLLYPALDDGPRA
jgi:alkylation response protein AidB-like acyl-CoA dehydrogenase